MDQETKEMFNLIINKLDNINRRLENVESRQDEIYQVVTAIEHSNKIHKAQIDNLQNKSYHLEGTFNGIADYLNSRKAANE